MDSRASHSASSLEACLLERPLILQSTPVLRQLMRKQVAAAGYKPHGLGSGAQDKNT